mmetsp:Transcript_130532/g.418532  ORF Transcript_130532/g.418532 Transcript_130532/m.418532 type:complete len:317 (-) Transcript_130532:577-1527(-)
MVRRLCVHATCSESPCRTRPSRTCSRRNLTGSRPRQAAAAAPAGPASIPAVSRSAAAPATRRAQGTGAATRGTTTARAETTTAGPETAGTGPTTRTIVAPGRTRQARQAEVQLLAPLRVSEALCPNCRLPAPRAAPSSCPRRAARAGLLRLGRTTIRSTCSAWEAERPPRWRLRSRRPVSAAAAAAEASTSSGAAAAMPCPHRRPVGAAAWTSSATPSPLPRRRQWRSPSRPASPAQRRWRRARVPMIGQASRAHLAWAEGRRPATLVAPWAVHSRHRVSTPLSAPTGSRSSRGSRRACRRWAGDKEHRTRWPPTP